MYTNILHNLSFIFHNIYLSEFLNPALFKNTHTLARKFSKETDNSAGGFRIETRTGHKQTGATLNARRHFIWSTNIKQNA